MSKIQCGKEQLWKGCMLASIAHAIMVAHYPEISNEHSWDEINYSVQDSAGTRGTITFDKDYYIAAFRDDNSERLNKENNMLDYKTYFSSAPKEISELAEKETLQYLLEEVYGNAVPLITTAIWGNETGSFSRDTFTDMKNNGGFLLERQMLKIEDAFDSWKEYYDMTEQQYDLLRNIYKRKIEQPNELLILSKEEINLIGSDDKEGLEESKISFNEIGFVWEE